VLETDLFSKLATSINMQFMLPKVEMPCAQFENKSSPYYVDYYFIIKSSISLKLANGVLV
jgi:hypothetical protein